MCIIKFHIHECSWIYDMTSFFWKLQPPSKWGRGVTFLKGLFYHIDHKFIFTRVLPYYTTNKSLSLSLSLFLSFFQILISLWNHKLCSYECKIYLPSLLGRYELRALGGEPVLPSSISAEKLFRLRICLLCLLDAWCFLSCVVIGRSLKALQIWRKMCWYSHNLIIWNFILFIAMPVLVFVSRYVKLTNLSLIPNFTSMLIKLYNVT